MFDWDSSLDWVLAYDKKEAVEFYLNFTQCGDIDDCKITRIPKSKWKDSFIIDPDEPEPDGIEIFDGSLYSGGYKIIGNFEQFAEENNPPEFIATTEF